MATPPSTESSTDTGMKKTLGLTGVTVNAMALIAPGAFLWITFQLQAAQVVGDMGTGMAMWPGVVFALIVAFLTAISYSELAHKYPEAGAGSAYYFAEKSMLDRVETHFHRFARITKFVTGWAAHLFYWVYPGVMVGMLATLVAYILSQFGLELSVPYQMGIAVLAAVFIGSVAVRGITGSTMASWVINIIQLTVLVIFSIGAIWFRLTNPANVEFVYPTAPSVVIPFNLAAMLFQSTIAILILVGFESATALGAEAKNPKRDVPRAVILSLVIQGILAYLLEYFAANFALNNGLTATTADGTIVTGMDAAAVSTAPIGDLIQQIGNAMLGGSGFALMIIVAITVAIAVIGSVLACMNTAVRVSYAMAADKEMPEMLGMLHGKYATPHMAVWILVAVSAVIGAFGVISIVNLTAVTLASNIGTFILYALICVATVLAFAGKENSSRIKHLAIPVIGLIANIGMLVAIVALGVLSGGDSQKEAFIAIGIAVVWAVISGIYYVINSRRRGPQPTVVSAK
ncbi:MAG: APC family permease [Anaerolineae bacterium]